MVTSTRGDGFVVASRIIPPSDCIETQKKSQASRGQSPYSRSFLKNSRCVDLQRFCGPPERKWQDRNQLWHLDIAFQATYHWSLLLYRQMFREDRGHQDWGVDMIGYQTQARDENVLEVPCILYPFVCLNLFKYRLGVSRRYRRFRCAQSEALLEASPGSLQRPRPQFHAPPWYICRDNKCMSSHTPIFLIPSPHRSGAISSL